MNGSEHVSVSRFLQFQPGDVVMGPCPVTGGVIVERRNPNVVTVTKCEVDGCDLEDVGSDGVVMLQVCKRCGGQAMRRIE